MASSTGGSYDSDGSDSLICGFGPRRGRRDSVDSGDYQSGCDDDSRRSGIDLELTESQANLICGFDGDRNGDKKTDKKGFDKSDFAVAAFEETQSEDGAAQTMGADDVEDKKTDTDHHAIHPDGGNNGHQADASIASGASHDRGNKSRLRDHGGNQIVSTFLPMELKVNAPSSSARTNRDDGSLSRSLKSVDSMDMSMASEDAIVLMYNSLDDESSDEDGEDNRAKRLKRNENIVGRVYRGQTDDYGSIPLELEIESEISAPSDSSFTSKQSTRSVSAPVQGHRASNGTNGEGTAVNAINGDREKIRPVPPTKVEDVAEESESKTKSFRPFSSQSAQNSNVNSPSEKQDCIPQSESNKNSGKMDMLVPTKPPALNIKERKKETLNDAVPNNSNSNYAIGFPSTAPTPRDKISRINSLRKSTLDEDNLSIIEENDCDSSTGTSIMQSIYSEAGDDDSDASGSTSKDDDLVLDSLFSRASKSKAPKPMGEHAKSMAKKLGVPMRQLPNTKSSRRLEEAGRRAIVSRNSETEYVKAVVEKSEEAKILIRNAIQANILFKACSGEELDELVEVFAPTEASAGSTIIREGDEGDAFYVMEKGTVDVYEGDVHKVTLYAGASFGEIALLYGCPRSATLRAQRFCSLWSISRTAFRAITSQYKILRNQAKVDFLKKVKIKDKFLSDVLSETEINTLALATLNESYSAGHVIIREGDPGDIFYMIDSGSVDVFIKAKGSTPVVTLSSGKFFGELALLSNDVRTASCVAKTDVKCHILMRNDFNLMLGDLQSLMNEGVDYKEREREDDDVKNDSKESIKVQISDLELLKILGIGAFGRVRLAKLKHHVNGIKSDNGYFALKCISKQSLKENGLEKHILNEKSIMSMLKHPFINRFYCDMEDDKYRYFLLEALTGGELCKRLREESKFSEAWGKFYSASVLFAFCHMHAKKIAYRDLKPENLVMDATGYVKIVDFGLAKVIEGGKTWTLCGTPAYLAPEIVLNDGHDWAVDYWALGVFLFEMTSGKEPFRAKNPMEVYKQIVSGHVEIPPSFSTHLADLIRKLLNTSKSKRLGRTMGGGGAVMQHRWYSNFDWDAHLEKRLKAPLKPKTKENLSEDSVASDSKESVQSSSAPANSAAGSTLDKKPQSSSMDVHSMKSSRVSYSLGQGNRHHMKLLEMMEGDEKEKERQPDTVRMTMMRVIKQHERWSKTSEVSTNDSTRNTTIGVGPKMALRGSDHTEGGASAAAANMVVEETFLRLQLMHLSLASKRRSLCVEGVRAFQQFSLLSISPPSLINETPEFRVGGCRFLDPFATKNVDLIDQFPSESSDTDIDAEALAAFCFPNGLRIRIIPRCAERGARKLGWLGKNSDGYQLQGFTDVAGSLSHGVAITIRDELTGKDAAKVLTVIAHQRKRRRSAVVLSRWWRKILRHGNKQSGSGGASRSRKASRTPSMTMPEKIGSMKWKGRLDKKSSSMNDKHGSSMKRVSTVEARNNRRTTVDGSHHSNRRASATDERRLSGSIVNRVMSMNRKHMRGNSFMSGSMGDIAADSDQSDDDESIISIDEILDPTSFPEHIRRLGIEAYEAMMNAAKEGDMCIVEKSYVIIGTPLRDQSLFFCALQNLIDMERQCNSQMNVKSAKFKDIRMRSVFDDDDDTENRRSYDFGSDNRHAVLSTLQSKLSLSPRQRRISYPRSEMDHVSNPRSRFVLDLSIMGFDNVSLPLPLPEVSGQWGLATLFLGIKDSGLIILLKLLLLERSVLVVGETSEEVTACATALLELLEPYKWASAFMPLLPAEMLDFVSSPVPFIAGMIVEDKQHLHSIIHDPGVKDAMLTGLSIVNLVSGKLIVTRERGTSDMLRRSFQTIPELSLYQRRLDEYCKSPSSNLRSFQNFFRLGASPKESLTLRKIKAVIRKHLSQFTMGLSDKPDAWQQYGEFNESTGTFDFCPDKFIQPLKDRMIFQIQFQEMMAHTQLFVGYVEELQKDNEKRSNQLSGPNAKYIAQWAEAHWRIKYPR